MRETKPCHAAAIFGQNQAIRARRVVRIELQTNRTRVSLAGVERHVLNVIVKPVRRAEAAAPHHRLRLFRIVERAVLQPQDRAIASSGPG